MKKGREPNDWTINVWSFSPAAKSKQSVAPLCIMFKLKCPVFWSNVKPKIMKSFFYSIHAAFINAASLKSCEV